jgi:hypothetical protein
MQDAVAREAARRAADRQLYETVVRSAHGSGGKVNPRIFP